MKTHRHDRYAPEPLRYWMQRDTPAYAFERYQRRPVYAVQCFTAGVYLSLGGCMGRFRIRKAYRAPEDQAMRDAIAVAVRQMRASGLAREQVMLEHEKRLADSTGYATRVDITEELKQFASVTS